MKRLLFGAVLGLLALAAPATAQYYAPPQVQTVNPTDLFQDVPLGAPQAQTNYATGALLGGFFSQSGQADNFMIGGDAAQNLWQRGTTGPSTTGTYLYNADRWFGWSGTNTAFTTTQSNTSAALPTGVLQTFRVQRTAAQTGVVQLCGLSQIIRTQQAVYLAGHTVEADFNVYTGANFSATSLNAYITYGTGTDDGAQKLAYGLNAGGGGASAWTGQANATTGALSGLAVSTAYKAAVVANIPSTATEVALTLCYTPVGTAGTTDALYFSNVELRKADYLSNFVNSASAYTVTTNAQNASTAQITATINGIVQNAVIPAFSRRQDATEATLQYSYFDLIAEANTAGVVQGPAGSYDTTTTCTIAFPLPAPMWKVPTLIVTAINAYNALSATTFKINPTTTPVVLASAFAALQTGASTTTSGVVSFKTTTETQYVMCELNSTASGGGAFAFNAEE